jgi:ABC-type multidrug transport system fused ATPase/permease subunit
MDPEELYTERVTLFEKLSDQLQQKENRLSLARLIVFVLSLLLFFLLFSYSARLAVAELIAGVIIFGILIKKYNSTEKLKDYNRRLVQINTLELKSIAGDSRGFADGNEFIDRDHPNSYDLDLFGHASVYQFLNRTNSLPGARLLSMWLKAPADMKEIRLRQLSVQELNPDIDWRQQLMTTGYFTRNSLNDPGDILAWVQSEDEFLQNRFLKVISIGLSTLGILITGLVFMGWPVAALLPFLLINSVFYLRQGRKINRLHLQVSKSAGLLQTYAGLIALIGEREFTAEKLVSLQRYFKSLPGASFEITRLSKLVNRLDTRLNVMVSAPLNLLFFWDIHCCVALEKWKKMHAGNINRWIDAMAEFEVLNSMANLAFNHPSWAIPAIVPGYFTLRAENLGHPLIPEKRRILNRIDIAEAGKILIITGSNMSGKSTFLRTCGVNAVLAMAGAPVCASSFTLSPVQVFTSMRISDSLEDSTSSFYAELKRLAAIIQQAERDPKVLLLLDEILRGTNSNDRYTGSVALIRQLSGYGTVAIVATHDLRLAGLEKELPGKIGNYHFDVQVDGEELYFDYKLTPGICTSMNASILMKKMGIRI